MVVCMVYMLLYMCAVCLYGVCVVVRMYKCMLYMCVCVCGMLVQCMCCSTYV